MPYRQIAFMLLAIAACLLAGCAPTHTGDATAVQNLAGKRIGVVVRATRYVYGDIPGRESVIHNNKKATDSPDIAYIFADQSRDAIGTSLEEMFDPIRLDNYRTVPEDESGIRFEGEMVLVSPNNHASTLPLDDKLRDIISAENLDGLIIIDQDWFFSAEDMRVIACYAEIRLLDSAGNVIFHGEPGVSEDGKARYATVSQEMIRAMTFGLGGEITSEDIQDALEEVNNEVGESIINRLNRFVGNEE